MNAHEASVILRQRTRPRIWDFCYLTTRSHLAAFFRFKELLRKKGKPLRILDLGCGQKPFEQLLKDIPVEKYLGVDFDTNRSRADLIATVDALPLPDEEFDAVILSEVLEHTLKLEAAIVELKRVSKPGALIYISTPFMFGEHGRPYDFQRLTRYKYFDLFKHDKILFFEETNSNFSTIFFLCNVAWEVTLLKKIPVLTPLIYVVNNSLALGCEGGVKLLRAIGERLFRGKTDVFHTVFGQSFYSMPAAFHAIIEIIK